MAIDLSVTGGKEIRDISVKKSDNGGYVLRFCIYTPSGAISESSWVDKVLTYRADQKDVMMADLAALLDKQF